MTQRTIVLKPKGTIIRYPVTDYTVFLLELKEQFRRQTLIHLDMSKRGPEVKDINPFDFTFIKPIGMGTFGMVYLTQLKCNKDFYAIKVLRKKTIIDSKARWFINRSRRYIEGIDFPFCQKLLCSFQDTGFLFLCQKLRVGGDLYWNLCKQKTIYEPLTVFYAAQIVLAIEYLHYVGIVHRNIKPENILLHTNGYVKLTGFTFAKKIRDSMSYTLCGTTEYMAPEMIKQKGHNRSVDWWSLGVLIYELVAGFTPFGADDPFKTYENITKCKYAVCAHFSLGLEELLLGLLKIEPFERLGMVREGVQEVKDARFFQDIDWLRLINQELHAPFIPPYKEVDSNFPELEPVKIVPPKCDSGIALFRGF
ncbi:cAMP-dependent protein kinase catalytic subunit 1-like [Halyomorpha halys]|uniref:cAMP-dependent protein kinase catalytic subunit 1-like n=1 Tax=Halyomorpha halys TaxID=286706 RepID=UPI0006D50B05|nr:cAMP-dependent protein kinase catalytic subunit-like [Halyomorpha halys]